jgi:hypothetical protein
MAPEDALSDRFAIQNVIGGSQDLTTLGSVEED